MELELNDERIQNIRTNIKNEWFEKFGKIELNDLDDDEIMDHAIQMLRYCDNLLINKNEKSEEEIFKNELLLAMKVAIYEDIKKLPQEICNQIINLYHNTIGVDGIINFIKACKLNN